MDISELVPVFGAVLLAVVLLLALVRLRRIGSRPMRLAACVTAGGVAMLALLVAGVLSFFLYAHTRHLPPLMSPDGKHVALRSYTVGDGSGVDMAEVAVRHAWDPYAHRVYTGPVRFQPDASPAEPEVTWMDATHLRIRFHTLLDANGRPLPAEQGCAAQVEEVAIRCEETRVHVNLPGR